jgi:hypothetical protein
MQSWTDGSTASFATRQVVRARCLCALLDRVIDFQHARWHVHGVRQSHEQRNGTARAKLANDISIRADSMAAATGGDSAAASGLAQIPTMSPMSPSTIAATAFDETATLGSGVARPATAVPYFAAFDTPVGMSTCTNTG